MTLYETDPSDKDYVIFNSKGKLIGLNQASEEIKQKYENHIGSGGICYVLSQIISLAPIIENYIEIKELSLNNGIRLFEVINKVKEDSKQVRLKIGKMPGFPKSEIGIDIQVLLEYLKEEIRDANKDLIDKIKNSKNKVFNFDNLNENQKKNLDEILKEIADNFNENSSKKKYKYGDFIEKKGSEIDLKDRENLMKKILSDKDNFDYIVQNIPGFLMSSGGYPGNVSEILVGRPSKKCRLETVSSDELEKKLKTLCENSINELNFLTISNKTHAFAIKDTIKIKIDLENNKEDKTLFLIRNPWGSGREEDICTSESDNILNKIDKNEFKEFWEEFQNFNNLYTKTGKALLNAGDIQKKFESISILDFEAGKYIYTYKIIDPRKHHDFILEINKKDDDIKFDATNFNTDLQYFNSGRYCFNKLKIYKDPPPHKEINWEDFGDIDNKNVVKDLIVGKKYLIEVDIERPCNFNIIRKFSSNKVHYLGEHNDNNINFCRNKINETYDDKTKNSNIFEEDIKDTLRVARLMETICKVRCIRQFKKISKDEIILHGISLLTNALKVTVINDRINHCITGNCMDNKIEFNTNNGKIKDLPLFNKIGIIDDNNEVNYINVADINKHNVQKYICSSFQIYNKNDLSIKNYIFNNKDDAIKKMQEIAKNNAGLIKDFMTGGVEFKYPIEFKNFKENFYAYKEHIIAFKCEKNALSDIKNTLVKLLDDDIKINSLQEIWDTILDELISGFLVGGCLPFISLHFNEKSLLYSVMNANYKHTIVGHVY